MHEIRVSTERCGATSHGHLLPGVIISFVLLIKKVLLSLQLLVQ